MKTEITTVDHYISTFPDEVQDLMKELRFLIKLIAPNSIECLSYGMPSYKLNGKPLVYFAAFKSHIGFYAIPTAHEKFADELSIYKHGKGSVQFPLNQPLPIELIKKMIEFRVQENFNK